IRRKPLMQHPLIRIAFLSLAIALAACSKSEDKQSAEVPPPGVSAPAAPAAGKLLDPCALLGAAEASEILGMPAGAPELKDAGPPLGHRSCIWSPADPMGMGLIQVSLIQNEGLAPSMRATGYTTERLFKDGQTQIGGEVVPGLGDAAYYDGSSLNILVKGMHLSVSAGSTFIVQQGQQGLPAAKKVAEKIMPKI
ncbi:MAG: DUF3558 family protein, partial [Candidatus Binatia bacterium]